MAVSDDQIRRAGDALEPLCGRRLLEVGRYVDGDPLVMLVFAVHPDQDGVGPEGVRFAISSYDSWLLCLEDAVVAHSEDSEEMDVPGFRQVLGERLVAGELRDDGTLSLAFSAGYRLAFIPPGDPFVEGVERWRITTPSSLTTLKGNELLQEA